MNYLTPEFLETDRLFLRTFRENDWKDLHKYYSDEECTKYTIGRTLTEGESWRTIAAMIGHWQLRKYGSYVLDQQRKEGQRTDVKPRIWVVAVQLQVMP
jgi:RimJ/RimL family protein N-acetyltransferase